MMFLALIFLSIKVMASTEILNIIQSGISNALINANVDFNPKFLKQSSIIINQMLHDRHERGGSDNIFFKRKLMKHSNEIFTSIANSIKIKAREQYKDESFKRFLGIIKTCRRIVTDKKAIDEILLDMMSIWFEAKQGELLKSLLKDDDWLALSALTPYLHRDAKKIGFSENEIMVLDRNIFNGMGVYQVIKDRKNPNAASYMSNWRMVHNLHDENKFRLYAYKAKMNGIVKDATRGKQYVI
jgi:hypothetical protein